MTHTLVLTEALPTIGMRALSGQPDIEVVVLAEPTPSALSVALPRADGVIMVMEQPALTAELIAGAGKLRVACRLGAGYDNFDVPALTSRGIPLVTTADANADTVAEHALYLMLALAKRGPARDREVKSGIWRRRFGAVELRDKTCLIVGYGRIGRRIAKLYVKCLRNEHRDRRSRCRRKRGNRKSSYAYARSMEVALPRADFLVVACAYTEATRGLIGADALARLPASAFVVNISRGPVVDERAVVAALQEGRLAGAGLDVLETEPPAPDNPLLKRDDVVLTPHSASFIDTAYDRMALSVVDKAVRGLHGKLTRADVVNPACFDVVR